MADIGDKCEHGSSGPHEHIGQALRVNCPGPFDSSVIPSDLDEAQTKITRANDVLVALCKGERFTMRVPADPLRDHDFALADALTAGEAAINEVRALREARDRALAILGEDGCYCDEEADEQCTNHRVEAALAVAALGEVDSDDE